MSTSKTFFKADALTWILILLIIAICGAGIYRYYTKNKTVAYTQPPVTEINITASQYAEAYRNNSVAADAAYLNKPITVRGVISRIGKDLNNKIYIALKIEQGDDVYCYVSNQRDVLNLQPGETISFVGVGGGTSIIGPLIFGISG